MQHCIEPFALCNALETPHPPPLLVTRHSRLCKHFNVVATRHRRLLASTLLQKCSRNRAARRLLSSLQRSTAATKIQSCLRIHYCRISFAKAAREYIERLQRRSVTQAAAAWRGFWQRKVYLAGLKRVMARERRVNANTLFRNWSAHLVRAVMKIAGRRLLRATVVEQVRCIVARHGMCGGRREAVVA